MATRQGPRFGQDKGVQRNKDNVPGQKLNRSPRESNANEPFPSLLEDVDTSHRKDVERIKKGISPTAPNSLTRSGQEKAGLRALSRTASRAGYLGGALSGGMQLGELIDEKTGAGKKLVKAVLGEPKDDSPRVELSEYAKERLSSRNENYGNEGRRTKSEEPAKKATAKKEKEVEDTPVREGRNENIDEDTRKRAMASVANLAKGGAVKKYAKGGVVQANCGASMKPAQNKKY